MFNPDFLVKHLLHIVVRGESHLVSLEVIHLVVGLQKDNAQDPKFVGTQTYLVVADAIVRGYEKNCRDRINMVVNLQVYVTKYTWVSAVGVIIGTFFCSMHFDTFW